jgi:UPF0755 protein
VPTSSVEDGAFGRADLDAEVSQRPRRSKPKSRGRATRRGVSAPDPAGRKKTLAAVVALAVIVLVVGIPVVTAWRVLLVPQTNVAAGQGIVIDIPEGADTGEIAEILAQAGVVENASLFRLRARLDGVDGDFRPGAYELETGMTYEAVVERLTTGVPVEYVTVTIPEGLTVTETAARVEEATGIPAAEFTSLAQTGAAMFAQEHPYLADAYNGSLEGYLFPKTYRVVEGSAAADVIELMLDQFDAEIATVDLAYPTKRGMSLGEVVTAASIIEREAQLADERPLVSSVIYNRLDRDMLLEMCATVEYLLPGTRPRLTYEDLKIDSPYNTYIYPGLPPGPIASPGLASLQAAASPAKTDYLYYVLTGDDGSHTFAENYDDFLKAKADSKEAIP